MESNRQGVISPCARRFARINLRIGTGVALVTVGAPLFFATSFVASARKDTPRPTPAIVTAIETCRAVADSAARLSCYDRAAASLNQAVTSGDVVVVDREQVRQTQRNVFGYSFQGDPLLNGGSGEEPVNEITTTIVNVRALPHDEWVFSIEGGAVWKTVEARPLFREPKKGMKVTIKRGLLGSFLISFDGDRSVKVKRVS